MISSKYKFVITGVSGWLGSGLKKHLLNQGFQVYGVGRSENFDDSEGYNYIQCSDINKISSISFEKDVSDLILVHTVGLAHQSCEAEPNRFYEINDRGSASVVAFAKKVGIKKIVYVGSIAAYHWDGNPKSEDDLLDPQSHYAKSKLAGEKHFIDSKLDYRIVRLGTVFGKGDIANFGKLSNAISANKFIVPGSGDARKSCLSIDNAVDWITKLAPIDEPKYRIINLAIPIAPTLNEISNAFAEIHRKKKVISLSLPIMKIFAWGGDFISKIKPSFPFTSDVLNKLTQSTWVDCSKAAEMIPEINQVSFQGEINKYTDWYRGKSKR